MGIRETKSSLPLAFGLVGGILAIVGGMCLYALGSCADAVEALSEANTQYGTIWTVCGILGLVAGVLAIVGGSLAKTKSWGSLLLAISGIAVIAVIIVQATTQGGFNIWNTIAALFMLIGGFIGMSQPKEHSHI